MAADILARHSLTNRIAASTLLICLLGLWSLLFYASRVLHGDMERMLGEQQYSTAAVLAADIDDDLQLRFKVLENTAKEITPALLARPAALQLFLEERTSLQDLFNLGAIIVAPDGRAIADLPRSSGRIGINYMETDAIAVALRQGRSGVSRPVLGKKTKAPVFAMAVPIRNAKHEVVAALAGGINLEKPSFLDKLALGHVGKSGGLLLVSAPHRLIVTATDPSRTMMPVTAPGTSPLIDRFVAGHEGSGVFIDPLGTEVLASGKMIPIANWCLVVSLPTEEAFAPLQDMRNHMVLATLVLSLLTAGLSWWIVRCQLAPLVKTSRQLGRLEDDTLPAQALAVQRQDEVGLLIDNFNRLLEASKRHEAQYREAESRLRQALDTALLGDWEVDLATLRIQRSRRDAEIFGQPASATEWTQSSFLEHVHPEDRPWMAELISRQAGSGEDFRAEFRIIRDDKAIRWVWASGSVFKDTEGKPVKVFGVIGDITEQKTAEIALRQSEQYKQSILDSVNQEVVVLDQDGVITLVNAAWRRFALENSAAPGRAADSTGLGVNYLNICLAGDGDGCRDAGKAYAGIRNVLDGTLPSFTFEYDCHTPGRQRWYEMTVTPFNTGQRSVVITHSDITSRKALVAVLESKTLLQGVIDSTPDWIHVRDREHRFMLANRSFAAAFNKLPDDMIGHLDTDLTTQFASADEADTYSRHIRSDDAKVFAGETIHNPCDRLVVSGEVRYFDTIKGPLRDAAQGIFGVLTYRRDVSERFVNEQEQRTLENQLRQAQKMELIGHLTGGIAHDFNNILAAMLGYAELAAMEQETQRIPRLSGYLDQILQAGIRAKELVAQLLTFSQRRETASKAISPGPIVNEVAKLMRATMPSSILIDVRVADDLPPVLISPVQLHQVVMNLCVNARDAVAGKGVVKLAAEQVAVDDILTCESCHHPFAGHYLMISVGDSGMGIAAENLGRIFDPFFTTKPVGKGSGLGLSVLHGIVHSAGGHISVLTAPEAGTEFRVYLPPQPPDAHPKEAADSPTLPSRTLRGRVMVVDDEASIVGFMTSLLKSFGCEVTGFTDANEALAVFEADPLGIDMVITDQTMPGWSGIRLASTMLVTRPDIPIVIVTGNNHPISIETAYNIGIRRILSKPVPVRVLADIVGECLGTPRRQSL